MYIDYLNLHWPVLIILFSGIALLILVGFVNWYGNTKARLTNWIAAKIFRDSPASKTSADSLVMTVTSFLVGIGGLWVLLAWIYLTG